MTFTVEEMKQRFQKFGSIYTGEDIVEDVSDIIGLEDKKELMEDFFLSLKKYQETVVVDGFSSGNITAQITDGTVHKFTINGDVTGITLANISTGGSATLILTQDGTGGSLLDTTTYPSNWTNWKFTNEYTDLSTGANEYNIINVFPLYFIQPIAK